MKVALVHDYMREFGGAERVLRVLADIYPEAPIYVAFKIDKDSCAAQFRDRVVKESFLAPLIKYWNLYSPLRFLIPLIWWSMDLSKYDLVITSCSSFVARGFRVGKKTKIIAYCHTPPKFLYGYETSVNLQRFLIVRIYATIVNHFLRLFDFTSAQRVDKWIVNSKTVQQRVAKFYRKEAEIVYPPLEIDTLIDKSSKIQKDNYYLIVSRLVGSKGLEEAALAAKHLKIKIKIAGESAGLSRVKQYITKVGGESLEFLGRVSEENLFQLYAGAKGFLALARNEDFGMTVVEAQACGTPVIAYNGGGFRETVIDGKTGILINSTSVAEIEGAIKKLGKIKWKKEDLQTNAKKYDRINFEKKIRRIVAETIKKIVCLNYRK